MPVALSTPDFHFVHAGIRPGLAMKDQEDVDLMWIRDEFMIDVPASNRLVIHGHTPAATPTFGPGRIGIDTGVYMGGPLTAIRIVNKGFDFLSVEPE